MDQHKKVVFLGGGTGTAHTLSGLQDKPLAITAVVCTTDNGGYSGKQREAFGGIGYPLPALGDLRQVMTALAGDKREAEMWNLRTELGCCHGNNILAFFQRSRGSLIKAIEASREVLAIRPEHLVLPAAEENADIGARYQDGTDTVGEFAIIKRNDPDGMKELFLQPAVKAPAKVLEEIETADFLVIGPGSLRTSLVAVLLSGGIKEAIAKSKAPLICPVNLLSQKGQTTNWDARRHLEEINRYAGRPIDIAVVNNRSVPPEVLEFYTHDSGYRPHPIEEGDISSLVGTVIREDLIPDLAEILADTKARERSGPVDKTKHLLIHSEKLAIILFGIFTGFYR
ncbi:MAG: hypothetical protein A2927_01295 [Candidatus Komeilibacteria bacterium RIFCSPLOWO2_01_FULL_45_10]|uniref:Gluconeogenesis factor n=1 Tax=Candidatus Komeilibacteria bacterium RIFCSPLOWO2_01_FULL_45_10 TaxID=1798550 RepID=A0A1G2BJT4_9BACT|nr:MAG: hypothetical protein A2927_01295 [Candidatus Komeilibacteria bacterium RIFCSPLOWO2_01_FULL_45_10]